MKKRKLLLFVLLPLSVLAFSPVKNKPIDKGFAVVELFTSEGCSSCPPADAIVARLQKESAGKPIYVLAYHVDYWNNSSWKDAFSDAAYSARQRDYSRYLKAEVYTPQIVVNGKTEFVGSEEGTLHKAIATALQREPSAQLDITATTKGANALKFHFDVKNNGGKSILLIALIQKSAQTKVGGGENKGRDLSHVQIVRALHTIKLSNNQSGTETVLLPASFMAETWQVAGLVQSTVTGEIMGAAKVNWTKSSKSAE